MNKNSLKKKRYFFFGLGSNSVDIQCGMRLNSWWIEQLKWVRKKWYSIIIAMKFIKFFSQNSWMPTNGMRIKSDVLNFHIWYSGFKCLHIIAIIILILICDCLFGIGSSRYLTAYHMNLFRKKRMLVRMDTYDADCLSHSVSWQILAESGTYATGASVQSGYFAPNGAHSRFNVWFLW